MVRSHWVCIVVSVSTSRGRSLVHAPAGSYQRHHKMVQTASLLGTKCNRVDNLALKFILVEKAAFYQNWYKKACYKNENINESIYN